MASVTLGVPLPPPLPGIGKALPKELDLANSLSELAMRVLMRAAPGTAPTEENNQALVAATLYARAFTSFESALVLTGRGSVADARTIARSMAETAIVLNAVVLDRGVCDALMVRHEVNKRKLVNAWMSDPQATALMTDEHREKLETVLRELSAVSTRDPVNIATLADRASLMWLYNTVYRTSSSDAAHVTLDALTVHVKADATGAILGLTFGPRIEKLGDTLVDAMNCLLVSMHAITTQFSMPELQPEMDQHLAAVQKLSNER